MVSHSFFIYLAERLGRKRLIGREVITCFATRRLSFSSINFVFSSSTRVACRVISLSVTFLANKSSSSLIAFIFMSFLSYTQTSRLIFNPSTGYSLSSAFNMYSLISRTSIVPQSPAEWKISPSRLSQIRLDFLLFFYTLFLSSCIESALLTFVSSSLSSTANVCSTNPFSTSGTALPLPQRMCI